jgi:hypothetical protein
MKTSITPLLLASEISFSIKYLIVDLLSLLGFLHIVWKLARLELR